MVLFNNRRKTFWYVIFVIYTDIYRTLFNGKLVSRTKLLHAISLLYFVVYESTLAFIRGMM